MNRRKFLPLGGWLLMALFALGYGAIKLTSATTLLSDGVTTRGVIVGQEAVSCGKWTGQGFSVLFADRTGQVYNSTMNTCDYSFDGSPGEAVSIVYLPDDHTIIAPSDTLNNSIGGYQFFTILAGLITLVLLAFWITKQIRKSSRQDQPQPTGF